MAPVNLSDDDYEAMAQTLDGSPNHKVLRLLDIERCLSRDHEGVSTKTGIYLDTETTGLDHKKDEVIELAMVRFDYTPAGQIVKIGKKYQCYREPSVPIDPKITELTGITADMVKGRVISGEEIAAFVGDAALMIAHNAGFDRPFAEKLWEGFAALPWACSQSQIDWAREGYTSVKLYYLATKQGFWYHEHSAMDDCLAALAILATPLPRTASMSLLQLRRKAAAPTWRVWAESAPFAQKDELKARGYSWNGGENGLPKAWRIDVEVDPTAEIQWLRKEIYGWDAPVRAQKITAFERFSNRILAFEEEAA